MKGRRDARSAQLSSAQLTCNRRRGAWGRGGVSCGRQADAGRVPEGEDGRGQPGKFGWTGAGWSSRRWGGRTRSGQSLRAARSVEGGLAPVGWGWGVGDDDEDDGERLGARGEVRCGAVPGMAMFGPLGRWVGR